MNRTAASYLGKLRKLKKDCPKVMTRGLEEGIVAAFLGCDANLRKAVDWACDNYRRLRKKEPALLKMRERDLVRKLQEGYCNFYSDMSIKPYVPLAAKGPWIITTTGAVVYNAGSYGMLALGHAPPEVDQALGSHYAMANIMTPSFQQRDFMKRLRREIGHTRGSCPYLKFVCLNSGSEVVTLAATLSDVNAKTQTDPNGKHAGKKILFLAVEGSFHGRTGQAARLSDSTARFYSCLATFRDESRLVTVPPNDCDALEEAFYKADHAGVFFDSFFFEPVMGEGDPGKAMTPEFYATARRLTKKHNTIFVVDSIQAGYRARGCLSIVDYPGFRDLEPPDMETYAKALNGGQFPVSVLAMTEKACRLYQVGIYGNTMTANPRGLAVGSAIMDAITPTVRRNIKERGKEFLEKFEGLRKEFPEAITDVQGAGLLFSISLNPKIFKAEGKDSLEYYVRKQGVNVIHGGKNALRFTPYFLVTSREIDLVVDVLRNGFRNGPRVS